MSTASKTFGLGFASATFLSSYSRHLVSVGNLESVARTCVCVCVCEAGKGSMHDGNDDSTTVSKLLLLLGQFD